VTGSTTAEVRSVAVGRQLLRVCVRPAQGGPAQGGPGQAPRPPLLLINGIGASLELLEPFVDAVDPAVEVIRFDPPGVGGSEVPLGPYRFTGLGRLIARLLPRRYLQRGYLQQIAGDIYGGSARADPAAVAATMHDGNRVGPSLGYLYQLAAGAGWTSIPFLPWLRQPTLIMSGDDDPIIPLANGRLMHRLIPDSRLHVYQGGHLGLVTEAAKLAPVIDDFLGAP
jgi:pimeloyl-ACP methyl ester carboxylesterase